jgi:hypothetical protein
MIALAWNSGHEIPFSLHVALCSCPSSDRFRKDVFTTFDSHVV